ncbi:hypothetical protein AKJ16_DCAP18573 [Drosera capensis]
MDPPSALSMEDTRDMVVDDCCSWCYDCWQSCFDFFCCSSDSC